MPRVRRRPKRRRIGYTKGQVEHLLRGYTFLGDDFGREVRGTLDVEAMWEAWITLRDELLPQWIAENPGTRPYAWWQFDAPERRQRIGTRRYLYPLAEIDHMTPEPHYEFIADDKPHPFDNPRRDEDIRGYDEHTDPTDHFRGPYRLSFGVPSCSISYDYDPDDLETPDDSAAVYERQAAYLDRLGLLTVEERRIVSSPDFEPYEEYP